MKKLILFCSIIFASTSVYAFPKDSTFYSLEKAVVQPQKVKYLILKRKKYTKIPDAIKSFGNLVYLDLTNNNIQEIDSSILACKYLEKLCIAKNKLTNVPAFLADLEHLHYLDVGSNTITYLPDISQIKHLHTLLLWDNPLFPMPTYLFQTTQLKVLDVRGIKINKQTRMDLVAALPSTRVYFSPDCNCDH